VRARTTLASMALVLAGCSDRLDLGRDVETQAEGSGGGSAECPTGCFGGPVLELAHSEGNAKGLVLDDRNVYWAAATAQVIVITPKAGGPSDEIQTPGAGPYRVAANDTDVYFTSNVGNYVGRLNKATRAMDVVLAGEPDPEVIALADDGIYFVNQNEGTLRRASFDGTSVETLASDVYSGGDMAFDVMSLYYADSGRGEIHVLDRASLEDRLLASDLAAPNSIVLRGDDLYFLELGTQENEYADGRLARMPRDGGPIEVLLEGLDAPDGLAADASGVFLSTRGTVMNGYHGRILRRSDAGTTQTLAADQSEPFAVAVDDQSVYFTTDADSGLNAIRR
jgi:sugar lactone lactonase YvrE